MDLVDVNDWVSDEVKTITLSQILLDAPYQVRVREFKPQDGDMIEDAYMQNGQIKKYQITRYALADLEETAAMSHVWIDRNIGRYIMGAIGHERIDPLVWETYMNAFKHHAEAEACIPCSFQLRY
jgi:hypothetical protein